MHQLPDEYLADVMPIAKKIASAGGFEQYNVLQVMFKSIRIVYYGFTHLYSYLQNNGKLANQAVPHVHFHVIPKPNEETGLGVRWQPLKKSMDDIKVTYEKVLKNL
jgi:diadenosine tetraphosphate (Ap4A) HIT family hydrolase